MRFKFLMGLYHKSYLKENKTDTNCMKYGKFTGYRRMYFLTSKTILKYLSVFLVAFISCLNGRIIDPQMRYEAYAEVPMDSDFWQNPKWKPLEADGNYVIFKVNNVMDTYMPSDGVWSHSFLAVYDKRTQKVIETYSFVDTNGGKWEDPYKGGKKEGYNILGGEAAIKMHLGQGKWTAKEVGNGIELVKALRAEVSVRGSSPEKFSPLYNCKPAANDLLKVAKQKLAPPDMPGGEGGVVINPEPVSIGKGGSEAKRAVLESKPSEDTPFWTVEIPEDEILK